MMPYSLSGNSEENDIKMELLNDEWKISGGRFTNRNLKYKHIPRIYDECWNRPPKILAMAIMSGVSRQFQTRNSHKRLLVNVETVIKKWASFHGVGQNLCGLRLSIVIHHHFFYSQRFMEFGGKVKQRAYLENTLLEKGNLLCGPSF